MPPAKKHLSYFILFFSAIGLCAIAALSAVIVSTAKTPSEILMVAPNSLKLSVGVKEGKKVVIFKKADSNSYTPYDFGRSKTVKTKVFVIKNAGKKTLTFKKVKLDWDGRKQLSMPKSALPCVKLLPGKSCEIKIVFTPKKASVGEEEITAAVVAQVNGSGLDSNIFDLKAVTLLSNDAAPSPSASSAGIPQMKMVQRTISFSSPQGYKENEIGSENNYDEQTTAISRSFLIKNLGTGNLHVSAVTLEENSGVFQIGWNGCQVLKPTDEYCDIMVSFYPENLGTEEKTAILVVKSDDPTSPERRVLLRGKRYLTQ